MCVGAIFLSFSFFLFLLRLLFLGVKEGKNRVCLPLLLAVVLASVSFFSFPFDEQCE